MYILICDDEPAVARQVEQLARQHLEQRGIPVQCTVCTRGEEVLARTDLAQYQLALLDVDLETMTGIALGRRLKQQNPELVLVYISAYLEFAPEGYFTVCFLFFHRVHGKIKILLNKKIHKTLNFTVKIPRKKVGGADAKQTGRKGCGSVGHGNCGGRGSGGCGCKGIRPQPDVS